MPGSFEQGSEIVLESKKPVWLKLTVCDKIGLFSWSQDGMVWRNIRPAVDPNKLSDEYCGLGFTGAFVGMFCVDTAMYSKTAEFEYFSYKKLPQGSFVHKT